MTTTQDRPTAAELLQVLGAFLEIMPSVSGPWQFRARVAANVAHILERGGRGGSRYQVGIALGDRHGRRPVAGAHAQSKRSLDDRVANVGDQRIRDLASGKDSALTGGASAILDMSLALGGRAVVAATVSGAINVWELGTAQLLRSWVPDRPTDRSLD